MQPVKTSISSAALIFLAASLQAQWQYNNNNAYYTSGNVGIGITNPTDKLTVIGDNPVFRLVNTGGRTIGNTITYAFALDGYTQSTLGWFSLTNMNGANGLHDFGFSLWDGVSDIPERLRIKGSNGNVGIGTTDPQSKLHIRTGTNFNLHFNNNATASTITAVDDALYDNIPMQFQATDLRFVTNLSGAGSSEKMRLSANGGLALGNSYINTDPGAGSMIISGKAGIGTSSLYEKFQIGSAFTFHDGGSKKISFNAYYDINAAVIRRINNGPLAEVVFTGNGDLLFGTAPNGTANSAVTNYNAVMLISNSGKVSIGTTNLPDPDAKLAVYGTIFSTKVKVTQSGWSDYVFYPGYHLRPLAEVEKYIQRHQHLPEVPSAAEVEKNGIDVGDNQATLLKKIEELTLYLIEQNKKVEALEKEVQQLKKTNTQPAN